MTRKHTHFLWGVALATIIGSGAFMVSDAQASVVVRTIDTSMPEAINETVLSEVTRTNSVEVARVNTKIKLALDKTRAEQKRQEEQKAKEEAERKAKEEAERKAQEQEQAAQASTPTPVATELQFGADGLLVMQASGRAQQVVNLLLGIPGHANGAGYHQSTGLDSLISQLSAAEAIWVLHRIEGAGFGQTGDGYAGMDTPASHRAVVANQINRRFGGSIHALLYAWGTYSYGGY